MQRTSPWLSIAWRSAWGSSLCYTQMRGASPLCRLSLHNAWLSEQCIDMGSQRTDTRARACACIVNTLVIIACMAGQQKRSCTMHERIITLLLCISYLFVKCWLVMQLFTRGATK